MAAAVVSPMTTGGGVGSSRSRVARRVSLRAATVLVAGSGAVLAASAPAGAGVWTAPLEVGAADAGRPVGRDVAMDASGAAGFVWTSGGTMRATLRRAGGGFGATQRFGSG